MYSYDSSSTRLARSHYASCWLRRRQLLHQCTGIFVNGNSSAMLSQNTRLITVHTTIKAVTKILCVEMLRIERAIQKKKKKRSIWVRDWLQKKGATHTIFKELYDEDPREYKAVMRVTPEQVEILLNLIAPKIQRDDTLMRDAIPARVKLEITLVYLSSGISYRLLSVFFRVSKASIIKIIPEVCAAINESLKGYIKPSLKCHGVTIAEDDPSSSWTTIKTPLNREQSDDVFHYMRMKMYITRWKRYAVALLAVWVLVAYMFIAPLRCTNSEESGAADFQDRLKRVSSQLEMLKQQHTDLIAQIKKAAGPDGNLKDINIGAFLDFRREPPEEYENLRRRVYSNTKELWYYVKNELGQMMKDEAGLEKIKDIVEEIGHRKRSLLSDQDKMSEFDGYHEWRRREAANVSELVQRRLRYLQNPPDCVQARKLVCNLNKGCGFGCQVHHIVYCLIFAYATERTLILNSRGWRYNTKGWEYSFLPLSETCTSTYDEKVVQWPVSPTLDAKIISLPFIDSLSQRPKFLPLSIPKDLASRIIRFNGDPASWWIGQILKYILKPQPSLQKQINESIARMNFKSPIVGVHIRRTDKVGTEAAFHHLKEYMTHVKDYYDQLELTRPVDERRIYLASDDASVLEDARSSYPDYKFLGDAMIAKGAATHRRYTPSSLAGLLVDLHMLASCDYLVATFSSQVGRVAYEMMQTNRVDASDSYFSLDDIYYFGGQNAHERIAVMPHDVTAHDDVPFREGDLIGVAGNHWNGFGRGTNRRTNKNGLFPWYKTADHLVLYQFPQYKEVPLYDDTRQNDG